MTAIRPERLGGDPSGSERTGPEKYAPNRDIPEKLGEVDQAAATAFEGEIREFVRRDVAFLRRPRSDVDTTVDPASDNINALIRRVAGASMEEIDRVILELQGVRDMLRGEGERVSREHPAQRELSERPPPNHGRGVAPYDSISSTTMRVSGSTRKILFLVLM
jgi:hypothetical protein